MQSSSSAREVAHALGAVDHVVVEFDLRRLGGSALTADIDVPKAAAGASVADGIPVTRAPARDMILLSFALVWAETLGSNDVFVGVNALDYSDYSDCPDCPDCRPAYIAAFERMANLATKAGVESTQWLTIRAPLFDMTKAFIVRAGLALGVDHAITCSCYDPGPQGEPCGARDACRLRAKGFAKAGMADPLRARFAGR